ncbi:2,3-bisphosphoglycerate-independent phosphoglycerate mutase [Desulfobaculum xiamenense]|uniref:2,3-bisphosphoglycerate-independent phosphoglycerate mutase n=1 Tax=Desulfobaculum xiamenense TaxID=995050 RepID=A0A846QJG6_9BACT|nr:2,3-bisphosphoglycerate-independent phosphoglycerate mutase [Desulfobaculum xiamenense]NJB66622.1 2,3-bisphosphoglycerate-independent phosphoglycerate mutase [Desulfobaculum xiamenense]
MSDYTPTLLLILDGWGIAPAGEGNAVCLAGTPTLDRLKSEYPSTALDCSGRAVGLPDGFMGNSEVGHMNIGAGRVVYQDMTRIDMSIEDGTFAERPALVELLASAKATGGRLHLMGLLSDGGVHSHINHLFALLAAAKAAGVEVIVHAFMDGRDTAPDSGAGYMERLLAEMARIGWGRVATITGRYYAMDRDRRFERNALAYAAMTSGEGKQVTDPLAAVRDAYAAGEFDEFIKPRIVVGPDGEPVGTIADGDAVFFFNFRADRARQIVRTLFDDGFAEFERARRPRLCGLATMTMYEAAFPLPVAFPPVPLTGCMGEVVSSLGLRQLRIAETEKYAHVTYFFNCGREEPFSGEDRKLVPSPREVATYDQKPEMSANEVTSEFERLWSEGGYDFAVLNLANLDMVGHTGIIPAACKAVKTVDECVARIVPAVLARGGRVLLTADHGNAEEMIDASGGPQTAHSKNQVPLVLIENGAAKRRLVPGRLGDIAPTILSLWGVTPPAEMTGRTLVEDF